MRLLLDSHVLMWLYAGDRRLTANARGEIEKPENSLYVSVATHWELSLKQGLGRLRSVEPFAAILRQGLPFPGTELLGVELRHVAVVMDLPLHHGDPFDRMLIAQAATEGLTIVTHDRRLAPYGAPILWT